MDLQVHGSAAGPLAPLRLECADPAAATASAVLPGRASAAGEARLAALGSPALALAAVAGDRRGQVAARAVVAG